MIVQQIFFKNTLRNFSYLISFSDGEVFCIDPFRAIEIEKELALEKKKLKAIINTHDHCDHYSGNEILVKRFNCDVFAHTNAHIPLKSKNLFNGDLIHQCEDWTLVALDTPGHTLSHICLMLKKADTPYALFTGDCFFNAGVGNCHNGGNPEILYETINSVFNPLPDELLIYPGHEYLKRNLEFTKNYEPNNQMAKNFLQKIEGVNLDESFFVNSMKTEREINTFLRLESSDLKEHLNLKKSDSKNVFLTLRQLRNSW